MLDNYSMQVDMMMYHVRETSKTAMIVETEFDIHIYVEFHSFHIHTVPTYSLDRKDHSLAIYQLRQLRSDEGDLYRYIAMVGLVP